MAEYWVGDRAGRRLGPVRIEVLRDLIMSGRLRGLDKVSTDGKNFRALTGFPEIAELFVQREATVREGGGEAERILSEVARLKEKPIYEVFGLKPNDAID